MGKRIIFEGTGIICTVRKHARAKRITLSVKSGGKVLVTIPRWVSYKKGKKFALEHLVWIKRKLHQAKKAEKKSILEKGTETDYKKNKAKARKLVEAKIKKYNRHYNFLYKRIAIRNQRTRWGSCSDNKNLNFNYRIVFLADKQADYLVVHELCHLKQMNHSKKFWDLVAQTIPDCRQIAKEVRGL